jgi:hypothetical protein
MNLTDTRIYRILYISNEEVQNKGKETTGVLVKPYNSRYTYAGDFFETPEAVKKQQADLLEELRENPHEQDKVNIYSNARVEEIKLLRSKFANTYTSSMSMIHPYALIRLSGTNETGSKSNNYEPNGDNWDENTFKMESTSPNIFDSAGRLKWYEVDARLSKINNSSATYNDNSDSYVFDNTNDTNITMSNYAKSPTTKDLINWSTYDKMGRFPYSFQDFVFCKYWNRIENNRLITLRRYAAPVLDNVMPANYANKKSESSLEGSAIYQSAFPPVATAVTYFGEGTDNSIKDILNFSVGYKWSELTSDVHKTTSNQIEEGKVFGDNSPVLNSGLGILAIMLGVMGDYNGKDKIGSDKIAGNPPDPYENGPYENRVIGPVNVIMNVQKRERGLKFEQDSIVLTFDYIARPISYVNNKAILLDLLANILAMTYSSGVWFGGAHRYRVEHPAVYPWRDKSSLNKIYQGKLFGTQGAFSSIFHSFFNRGTENFVTNFANDIIEGVKAYAKDLVNAIKGGGSGSSGDSSSGNAGDSEKKKMVFDRISNTAGRAVAAHLMRGAQVPWLEGARALLTGEPVGDWHITLGNPMNPIAMIGNLIVDNCKIEFYDELGPDDFPIGFKAKITLKHGMGRDKDAVESMFNRGNGRIYILSDAFKSSADHETSVDNYTGSKNPDEGKVKVTNYGVLQTTGSFEISKYKMGKPTLSNDTETISIEYNPDKINAIKFSGNEINGSITNIYRTTPWAMHHIL